MTDISLTRSRPWTELNELARTIDADHPQEDGLSKMIDWLIIGCQWAPFHGSVGCWCFQQAESVVIEVETYGKHKKSEDMYTR